MKLAEARRADNKTNCLTCRNFSMCADPKKHFRYACGRWGAMDEMSFSEDAFMDLHESAPKSKLILPAKKKLIKSKGLDLDSIGEMEGTKRGESKLINMVNSALEAEISLPPDFRIDDRDMPLAGNVWEWISGKPFLASAFNPYPRQFELAVRFMADWCPRCSKKGFWDKMKVDEDMGNVLDSIQLLRRGRCPKCKSTRSEMVRTRELLDAIALVAVVGQRSGKSFTTAVIETFMIHKWLRAITNPQALLSLPPQQLLTGTYISMTFEQTLRNLFTPIRNFITDAPWFKEYHCIAEGSPVTLADGSTKAIETIAVGDEVKTFEGTSNVTNVFDNGVQECFEVVVATGDVLPATASHKVQCLGADGESLVWKTVDELTVEDFVVVDANC